MRKYLLSTGIVGVFTGGAALLRAARGNAPFTWRIALAWLSWIISLTLALGAINDIRRAQSGRILSADSPFAGQEAMLLARRQKRRDRRR